MAPYRLTVDLDPELVAKLRKYIYLRWGGSEGFYGKVSEVARLALKRFLTEELNKLKAEKEA